MFSPSAYKQCLSTHLSILCCSLRGNNLQAPLTNLFVMFPFLFFIGAQQIDFLYFFCYRYSLTHFKQQQLPYLSRRKQNHHHYTSNSACWLLLFDGTTTTTFYFIIWPQLWLSFFPRRILPSHNWNVSVKVDAAVAEAYSIIIFLFCFFLILLLE